MKLKFDQVASLIFLALGVIIIVEAQKIAGTAYGSNVGPAIFPIGLGVLLIFLSIVLFFESMKNSEVPVEQESAPQYKRFIIILVAAIGYAFLLEKLGYVMTTFAFLLIGFQTLEKGKWLTSILVAAGFSGFIYVFFVNVLGGSLPGLPF